MRVHAPFLVSPSERAYGFDITRMQVEVTEEELIASLDAEMDPHIRCCKVLENIDNIPPDLKIVHQGAVRCLKDIGIAVIDLEDMLSGQCVRDAASALQNLCLEARDNGRLQNAGREGADARSRSDEVMWLNTDFALEQNVPNVDALQNLKACRYM